MITIEELDFLRESNNIENEWDDKSLQDAILAWEFIKTQKKLTVKNILEVHKIGMRTRTTLDDVDKGVFRTYDVWIGGHKAKPWFSVPSLMEEWIKKVNIESDRYESFGVEKEHYAREAHVQYEAIHPFGDYNGRSGRIFMNWERIKLGLPILVILEKEKQKYYDWFK